MSDAKPGPEAYVEEFNKASALLRDGKLDQAEETLTGLLRAHPDNAHVLNALGAIHLRRHRAERALPLLERAVALDPALPQAHHHLGYALIVLGERERGVAHLYETLKLNPASAPTYLKLVEAVPAAEGLKLLPGIRAALRQTGLADRARQDLHFAAADLLDAAGRYDQAFAQYAAANRAWTPAYPREANDRLLAASREAFHPRVFENRSRGSPGKHIFVVGLPRSGTTLLERILSAHPDIVGAGERLDIGRIARALRTHSRDGEGYPNCIGGLPRDVFEGFAGSYRGNLRQVVGDGAAYVDKNPFNFQLLGLIALMFPDAIIFHCRRHPIDTAFSLYRQSFNEGLEFSYSFEGIGHYFRYYQRFMAFWESVLPVPIHEVVHEKLVQDFDREGPRILSLTGLGWHDDCARFQDQDGAVYTASQSQVRKPLNAEGIGRWRHYAKHLGPLVDALWPPGGGAA